jgi:hypothetical protein
MTTSVPGPLPAVLLESLLRQAPLDVLLFDMALRCRYAALAGETLFGRTAVELLGRPAAEILPPAGGELGSALRLAAEQAAGSQYPTYRYTFTEPSQVDAATTQTLYCWSVHISPVLLHDYRGQEEFRGVLVTLADVQDLADANERLSEENTQLRRELVAAHAREAATVAEVRATWQDLRTTVRTLLTPVAVYLQLLSRRPVLLRRLLSREVIEQDVLSRLHQVVEAVDTRTESGRPDDASGPA